MEDPQRVFRKSDITKIMENSWCGCPTWCGQLQVSSHDAHGEPESTLSTLNPQMEFIIIIMFNIVKYLAESYCKPET